MKSLKIVDKETFNQIHCQRFQLEAASSMLTENWKSESAYMLNEFTEITSYDFFKSQRIHNLKHNIYTKVKRDNYEYAFYQQKIANSLNEIGANRELEIEIRSKSAQASHIYLAPKKCCKWRLLSDYIRLNNAIIL